MTNEPPAVPKAHSPTSPEALYQQITGFVESLLRHDGYGELRVEVRILKRGQKEVIVHFGHQYRHVLDNLVEEPSEYPKPRC